MLKKFLCSCDFHSWGETYGKGDMLLTGSKDKVFMAKINGAEHASIIHARVIQKGLQACTRAGCAATRKVFRTGAVGLDGYMNVWFPLAIEAEKPLEGLEVVYTAANIPVHW